MKRTITTMLLFAALATRVAAQHDNHSDHLLCGTDMMMQKVFAEHPEIKADFERREAEAAEADRLAFLEGYRDQSRGMMQTPIYTIPVVFHIIHDYGSENISDAQVRDAVRIMNEDYNKDNADTSSIVPTFQGIAADAQIQFKLANLDPNGNCTNGIDRIVSNETYIGDDGSKLNSWPRSKYLNIWVVKNISNGAAGYAYLPGTAPTASVDGIIILSTYVGSIGTGNTTTARALTHEIGHFLNLQHVWGSSNNPNVACGNDNVSDTPVTKGWTTCNLTTNDVCNNNVEENVQNFMDYSYCYRMFTNGQKTRMHNALNSGMGQRSSLWTNSNLNATGVNNNPPNTCAPKADFAPATSISICAGSSVNFSDLSWNSDATAWSWSFSGGTPSTSTLQNPTIQYTTPGIYDVTLTASNTSGSNTKTRTGHIVVLPATAAYNNTFYSESFENSTQVAADWIINNPGGGSAFQQTTTAGYTGVASMKLNNYTTTTDGLIDELITPSINLTAINSPSLTFRWAYRQTNTADADKLRLLASTDCGRTWVQRWVKSGTNLNSVSGTQTSAFTPTTAQWALASVVVTTYANEPNMRFKFEFTSGGGNSVYIDDVNITGPAGLADLTNGIEQFMVFPNPTSEQATISVTLAEKQDLELQVLDITGRVVNSFGGGLQPAGSHNYQLNTAALPAGIYFVQLQSGGKTTTQKLIVQ